ncbi:hypothetical protein HDV01_002814 [Terramyces sp. JEL0728]|nr:hypothetical protein HDV01_002814 [Terramyces sp. JEL0728]
MQEAGGKINGRQTTSKTTEQRATAGQIAVQQEKRVNKKPTDADKRNKISEIKKLKKLEKLKEKEKELQDPNKEITKRLYIGGLADISSAELIQKLSLFGIIETPEYKNGFAFCTIKTNALNYKKLLKLNLTKWKKSTLKIQEAKQDYLIKLKREREEPEVEKKKNTKKNKIQFQELNLKKGWIRINGRLVAKLKQRLPNGRQAQPGMKSKYVKFNLEPSISEINFETTDLSKETIERLEKQRLLAGNYTEQELQQSRQCFLDYKTNTENVEKERLGLDLSRNKYELLVKERQAREKEKNVLDSVVKRIINNESMNVVEFEPDEDEKVDDELKSKLDLFSDSE